MKNILFYKYVEIADVEGFRDSHFDFCARNNLLGKVLVAKEGINGCLTGSASDIESYKQELRSDSRFSDLEFKEGKTSKHGFGKLIVRIRQEIITTRFDNGELIQKSAPYIQPDELKELYESEEEFFIIDARNDYESKIGHFKNAICPDIKTFRDWPEAVRKLEHLKDKTIITYCTGGIRCEKASAYMVEQGFKNVRQIHGGILNYGKDCGNDFWEGKCFVFDTRGAIDIDPENSNEHLTQCSLCNIPCSEYHNCLFTKCDKRFIACDKCHKVLHGCCSKNCRNHNNRNYQKFERGEPCTLNPN